MPSSASGIRICIDNDEGYIALEEMLHAGDYPDRCHILYDKRRGSLYTHRQCVPFFSSEQSLKQFRRVHDVPAEVVSFDFQIELVQEWHEDGKLPHRRLILDPPNEGEIPQEALF